MYASVKEVIAKLQKINPDEKVLVQFWYKSDVQDLAIDKDLPPVSIEEADSVLALINHSHDSGIGINWDVVESGIDTVRSQNS